ncbi:hypothetical protein CR513_14702, partial [Mucuna pruriens]
MTARGPTTEEDNGWFLSVDEASNQTGSEAGVILEGLNGVLIEQSLHFEFKANNNQAKYEALLAGMRLEEELEAKTLMVKSDSKLVMGQRPLVDEIPRESNGDGGHIREIHTSPCAARVERKSQFIIKIGHHPKKRIAKVDYP